MAFLLQNRQIIRFFILESYIGQHFYLLHVKVAFCSDERGSPRTRWLKNHPRFAAVFFRQALHYQSKRQMSDM